MVALLLEHGANANMHDKQERRPIHWASYIGYIEIVKLLVSHGASVNCLDKEVAYIHAPRLALTKCTQNCTF